jgi:hypothetical protein
MVLLQFVVLAASTKTVCCLVQASHLLIHSPDEIIQFVVDHLFFIYKSLFSRYVVEDDHGRHQEACPDSIMSLRLEV